MALYGFSSPFHSDPWGSLDQMRREMAELFDAWRGHAPRPVRSSIYPAVNLFETAEGYALVAELPGVREEDLGVSVERNRVTLRGERRIELPDDERTTLHRRERQSGVFRRTVELPFEIDAEKVQASYRLGVLRVHLPKRPEDQPRQIAVAIS